jgi:hypothetical protein
MIFARDRLDVRYADFERTLGERLATSQFTLNGSMKRRLNNEASVRSGGDSRGRNKRFALI